MSAGEERRLKAVPLGDLIMSYHPNGCPLKERVMTKISFVTCFFMVFSSVISAGNAHDERLNYRIVLSEKPTPTASLAAQELKRFLGEIYDTPITLNGSADRITFFAGVSDAARHAGFTDVTELGEQFGVFKNDRSILFSGYDDEGINPAKDPYGCAGTLLAVYYFLNKYAGVGFYFPGEKGYAVRKEQPLEFKGAADMPTPDFALRGFSLATEEFSTREMIMFSRRMLCCIPRWAVPDLSYTFLDWKQRFWDTHPEYFIMREGKRVAEGNFAQHTVCLSNPDVIRQAAGDIVEAVNNKPAIKTVRLFADAPLPRCQCPLCAASKERSVAGAAGGIGEELYGFQKKIADIVHRSCPDVLFQAQTKNNAYKIPPKLVTLGPRFAVKILDLYEFKDCSSYRIRALKPSDDWSDAVEVAEAWQKEGAKTFLYDYARLPWWKDYPIIHPERTINYFRRIKGLVAGTYYSDLCKSPYSFSAFGQFVQARALFNVNVAVNDLLREFCAFAYPGAVEEMVAFHRSMEMLFSKAQSSTEKPLLRVYTPENIKTVLALLEHASGKVRQDAVWFGKLHADFKSFYQKALEECAEIDREMDRIEMLPNLLPNPSLEGGEGREPAAWRVGAVEAWQEGRAEVDWNSSSAFCGWDDQVAHSGKRSLRVGPAPAGQKVVMAGWRSDKIPLKPDRKTFYSAWTRSQADGINGWGSIIRLYVYDQNGKDLSRFGACDRYEHDWRKLSSSCVTPPGTAYGIMACVLEDDFSITAWFDDIAVRQEGDSGKEEIRKGTE